MTRKRKRRGQPVSLFPFLNVLAAVIGALVLMIAGLSLLRIADLAVPPEVRFADLQEEIVQDHTRARELEALISEALRVQEQLEAAREELKRLTLQVEEAQAERESRADLLARVDQLRRRIKELQLELGQAAERIAELERELARRRRYQVPGRIVLQPGGSGSFRKSDAKFVECKADALLIHERPGERPTWIRRDDIMANSDLIRLFYKVRSRGKSIVIFLIRPDGVPVYNAAARRAGMLNVRHGKLPLPGYGEIDWKHFEQSAP